jgi:hypothetical protein
VHDRADWIIALAGLVALPVLAYAMGYAILGGFVFAVALLWSMTRAN